MNVVLVHSPLVGVRCWDAVAAELRGRGLGVEQPSLSDLIDETDFWNRAAERLRATTGPAVLYSAAGLMAPSLGGRRLVFVDALLPREGPDWWATVPAPLREHLESLIDGEELPPFAAWWGTDVMETLLPDPAERERFAAGCPPIPLSLLHAPLPAPGDWSTADAAYVWLSRGYDDQLARAEDLGWPTARVEGTHLSIITEPQRVADAIVGMLDR